MYVICGDSIVLLEKRNKWRKEKLEVLDIVTLPNDPGQARMSLGSGL